MSKNNHKIRINFVGQNSHDVTGSCTHIQLENIQFLIECGLYQSCGADINDYKINSARLSYKPKEIEYIFALHNHIDHIGKIPLLYARGCKAKIIAPEGTKSIAEILLRDCAHINIKTAELLTKRTGKEYAPLYTDDDVDTCLSYWEEFSFNNKTTLSENIVFNLLHSGHINNSAQLELWLTRGNTTKKIVYTSDLGNTAVPKYFIESLEKVNKCDLLIAESTYSKEKAYFDVQRREKDLSIIKSVINQVCIENKAKVLIPVFANDRCQNILTCLYDMFGSDETFNTPILIDSPMACKITAEYLNNLHGDQLDKLKKVMSWKNLVFVEDYETSKLYQDSDMPLVVLAASGMMVAGRSVNWAAKLLPNPNNHILFCGYAPENSLAGRIKNNKCKIIKIEKKNIANKCGISNLRSFSSHIQRQDMFEYYSDVNCEKIALVHGNFQDKCEFAKELQDLISKKNKNTKVISVNKGYEILL
jgi:metallo-beta-lactamase family protein